jgi:hypothetical protein
MCGTCDVWHFDRDRQVTPALLRAMSDQVIHRGPDEAGLYTDGSVGLGFRRVNDCLADIRSARRAIPIDPVARNQGLFDTAVVVRLIEEHVGGQIDLKERLWALLCFERRAREYLDG